MKSKNVESLLGALAILAAIYTLYSGNEYKFVVSLIIFLHGLSLLLHNAESEFYRTLSRTLRGIALVTTIVLLIKVILIG
jgi:hypothetical protein